MVFTNSTDLEHSSDDRRSSNDQKRLYQRRSALNWSRKYNNLLIKAYGIYHGNWSKIAQELDNGRDGDECRVRF